MYDCTVCFYTEELFKLGEDELGVFSSGKDADNSMVSTCCQLSGEFWMLITRLQTLWLVYNHRQAVRLKYMLKFIVQPSEYSFKHQISFSSIWYISFSCVPVGLNDEFDLCTLRFE